MKCENSGSPNSLKFLIAYIKNTIVLPNGCIIWTKGKFGSKGYGAHYNNGKTYRVHILAYIFFVDKIAKGLVLDHLCRNTSCCNPFHLEPVTQKINTLRGVGPSAINARKTHCINGHELTIDNLYITSRGQRQCKTCQLIRLKARKWKKNWKQRARRNRKTK